MQTLKLEKTTRILAVDIDGCLAPVEHAAYDLETISAIAELNRQSKTDASVPSLTIISGRPHAYVDALMQLLDIEHPASFENGVGLAFRKPYHVTLVPEVQRGTPHLETLAARLRNREDVILQPGKIASLSVFWHPESRDVDELVALVEDLVDELGLDLAIDPSQDCVNVLVPGVDKAHGLHHLSEALQVDFDAIAGIGDSLGDVAWLKLCGTSCAPANAHPDVRQIATFRSSLPDAMALLEFYQALVSGNRQLTDR